MASKVQLYSYDLTQGMARQLSPMLLGRQLEGVWHTSIVVEGTEYFFGYGMQRARAGTTPFGLPYKVLDLGHTEVDWAMREELLQDMAPRYRPVDYNLLSHNCNHFSNEFSMLLTGSGIPEYILNQADEVLNTPLGQMFMPLIQQMEGLTGQATASGFGGASATPGAGVFGAGPSTSTTTTAVARESAGGSISVAATTTNTTTAAPRLAPAAAAAAAAEARAAPTATPAPAAALEAAAATSTTATFVVNNRNASGNASSSGQQHALQEPSAAQLAMSGTVLQQQAAQDSKPRAEAAASGVMRLNLQADSSTAS